MMTNAVQTQIVDIELGECSEDIELISKPQIDEGTPERKPKTMTNVQMDEEAAYPKTKDDTHQFWLISSKTFSYVQWTINSVIILCLILQLVVLAGKATKLQVAKKYALLFLVLLTSIVNTIVAIFVLYGQYLFSKVPRLRQLINMLRMEVNRMIDENNILSRNINRLEQEQGRLHEIEKDLAKVVTSQGGNVQQFQLLVRENSCIIQRQKKILKEQWKQEIIATVLRTDKNGDFVITYDEVEMLMHRIESLEEEAGMKLAEEEENKLRRILTTGVDGGNIGSIRALVKLIEDALDVNVNE